MISKIFIAIGGMAIACSPAFGAWEYGSAIERAGLYLCALEMGGGARYSTVTEMWSSSTFRTSEAFVFDLKFIDAAKEGDRYGIDFQKDYVARYEASMKYAGTDMSETCGTTEKPSLVDDYGRFSCSTPYGDYEINFSNLKFVSTRTSAYLGDNIDNEDVEAALLVGTCTKVN